jgi:DNA-binding HxlR family transcriptional regulator
MKPCDASDPAACARISEMLALIADKWSLLVIRALAPGPLRFNALRRDIGDISQKMLASTLRNLERDGFVTRTVTPSAPPRVDYALSDLGHDLKTPVCALADWTLRNTARIEDARAAYELRSAGTDQPFGGGVSGLNR